MIDMVYSRLKQQLKILRDDRLTAQCQHANDFYLVEHPKSGVTWLSVLLANVLLINKGSENRATFTSVRSYIPDVHVNRYAQAVEFPSPRVRLYKSHAKFNSRYVNIIYLVRHPVAVMASYYHYNRCYGHSYNSFEDFCFGSGNAVNGWKRHIASWLVDPHNSDQHFVHLIRYEDLVKNTPGEIFALAKNFGWAIDSDVIKAAAEASNREAMRAQEAFYRARNPAHRMEFISAKPREKIAPESCSQIETMCRHELELLGYSNERD